MQRKQERQAMGRLQDLIVKPGTLKKYHEAFNKFHDWATDNELVLGSSEAIDSAASQYVEALWNDGFGRSEASYILAAIQFLLPHLRHALPLSWRLVKTWARHEMPTRAVPLDASTALGFAGLFWFWGEQRLALGILVGFDFFLRTGEIFTIRRNQVEFFGDQASLQLQNTKTSGFKIHSERLLAWADVAVWALRQLCHAKLPGDLLIPASAVRFRTLWHRAVHFFLLQDYYIQPYSLRRGGATQAFRLGTSFDQLLIRGRRAHQRTARIYLDEALQQSTLLQFGPTTLQRLSWARQQLPSRRFHHVGARGRDGGRS
eukprot:s680_g12.t1